MLLIANYWALELIELTPRTMAFDVSYEIERMVGGSPARYSIKTFQRLSSNKVHFTGKISAPANTFFSTDPCLHHKITFYASVRGDPPCSAYRCNVRVGTQVVETAFRQMRVAHALRWAFIDHNGNTLQANTVSIPTVPIGSTHKSSPTVAHAWEMDFAYGVRTRVAEAIIAGGLHIPAKFWWFSPPLVEIDFDVDFMVSVIPSACVYDRADGTKLYQPIKDEFLLRKHVGPLILMEEPTWAPESVPSSGLPLETETHTP